MTIEKVPSNLVVDVDALLKVIDGDCPSGSYMRYQPIFDMLQESRRNDSGLPTGDWSTSTAKQADYPGVIRIATDILTTKSKDLMIAVWLVEALVYVYRFAGLRDGCFFFTAAA